MKPKIKIVKKPSEKLYSHQSLITEISPEVSDLARFLDIPVKLHDPADHLYIVGTSSELSLESFEYRRDSDVLVSSKVFCEILIDIKSGMSGRKAFNKQGYNFT